MTEIPEWLATLVGRLVIANEALQRQVAILTPPEPPAEPEDGTSS